MRKIVLDFRGLKTKREIHEYLAERLEFPPYYGKNLDALYDCLTEIGEPTAVACRFPMPSWEEEENGEPQAAGKQQADGKSQPDEPSHEEEKRLWFYLQRVGRTMAEAEEENKNLAVFLEEIWY